MQNTMRKKTQSIMLADELLKKHLFDLLKKEAGIYQVPHLLLSDNSATLKNGIPNYFSKHKGVDVIFTQRESECIHYLREEKSAKQTAHLLSISARTVEFHLTNAKDKAGCRSKLELLAKINIKK